MPCLAASAVQQLITDAHVPGLSMAVIDDRQATALTVVGVRNSLYRAAVDQQTIFGAASLSKPLFAYAVLQLVDAGKLAFDTPLSLHVPDYVADDPPAAAVTVRHVLSHTSGLPNWRSVDLPLKTYFPPGERFSYSGEGFVWLQRVVEAVTGESLNTTLRRLIFEPLGMHRSSYTGSRRSKPITRTRTTRRWRQVPRPSRLCRMSPHPCRRQEMTSLAFWKQYCRERG